MMSTTTDGEERASHREGSIDWTEKYRPKSLDNVVGNDGAKKKLKEWARAWEDGKPRKKAVILAGKPGIGKTTSALALAKDMGWDVLEMNASDDRNRDSIKNMVGRSAVDDTFSKNGEFIPYSYGSRTLLVLDEADNIFGSEDRGGVSELRNTIRRTEQPVALVVNDYYGLRRRSQSLVGLCKKVEFEPVNEKDIIWLLKSICKNEGISFGVGVLREIAERSDGDVRSAVRDLESIATGRDRIVRDDLGSLGYRNREAEIFPTLKTILQGRDPIEARRSVRELDEEPTNLIHWIDENLPREYRSGRELADGYDWLSKADVYLGRVYNNQYYRLWEYAKDLMTAGVGTAKHHEHRGWTRYSFPTWIRKMSDSKGNRSMRKNISRKIASSIHTTTMRVKSNYLPYFKKLFKEDEEFRRGMVDDLELNESDVAFLLEVNVDSDMVKELFKEEEDEGPVEGPVKKEKGDEKEEEKKSQKSLLEF